MIDRELIALKMLHASVGDNFNIWLLAGRQNATIRQQILSEFTGVKYPKAKCGVTVVTNLFHSLVDFSDCGCQAHRDRKFAKFAKEQLCLKN